MSTAKHFSHVLFDLDGTLADTAPDLTAALNQVLTARGRPALAPDVARPVVSLGADAMLRLGFGIDASSPDYAAIRDDFLTRYRAGIHRQTTLFPGMEELLARLESAGLPWGVVTNKHDWLTRPLMASIGLAERARCIVSGDTVARAKPHPDPILHACALMNCPPGQAVYVGDARRDVEAGHSAGTATVVARYGYVDPADPPEGWGADAIIDEPLDLLDWLGAGPA